MDTESQNSIKFLKPNSLNQITQTLSPKKIIEYLQPNNSMGQSEFYPYQNKSYIPFDSLDESFLKIIAFPIKNEIK